LPINYDFFTFIPLPAEITTMSLMEQLAAAHASIARRKAYAFPGPFGEILAFELRCSPTCSIYLNSQGDFAT
jgi:hypothetical protein